jgi:hypothetical protein
MTNLKFIAFDEKTGQEVKIGSKIETWRGTPVILKELTRARTEGRSGKIVVEIVNDDDPHMTVHAEYYDKVCNLHVKVYDLDAAPIGITILGIAKVVSQEARHLENRVKVFKVHPSYDSRADLKADANKLTGMFSLLIKLNKYFEVEGSDVRDRVKAAREAVESLYKK